MGRKAKREITLEQVRDIVDSLANSGKRHVTAILQRLAAPEPDLHYDSRLSFKEKTALRASIKRQVEKHLTTLAEQKVIKLGHTYNKRGRGAGVTFETYNEEKEAAHARLVQEGEARCAELGAMLKEIGISSDQVGGHSYAYGNGSVYLDSRDIARVMIPYFHLAVGAARYGK